MVIRIRFDPGDVGDVRFGISPLWVTVTSFWALQAPGRYPIHAPWIKQARSWAAGPGLRRQCALISALIRPDCGFPDFMTPPPDGPLALFPDELERLAQTDQNRVRADILAVHQYWPFANRRVVAFIEDPHRMLPMLVDALNDWHAVAIAPYWSKIRALLEADVAFRAAVLAAGGARHLLEAINPKLSWSGEQLFADNGLDWSLNIRGRGLVLTPGVFLGSDVLWNVHDDPPPAASYPVRAVATLWEGRFVVDGSGLAKVLGGTRARLLSLVINPCTTTDLAHRTAMSLGAVSQHLAALLAAGLVVRSRNGRQVFYRATDVGLALLHANGVQ
jgi:DNA-binding transcriptional ArsR family regulator